MKFAIIATSGKQYKVKEGDVVSFERLPEKTKAVSFSHVLLIADGDKAAVGTPELGVKVAGEVVDHYRDKKVSIVKFKSKVRYKRHKGHRQYLTRVRITKIPTA